MHNETDGIVGATTSVWCNELHKSAQNGDKIEGMWISQQWRWDGEVRNFHHDECPPDTDADSDLEREQCGH